MPGCCLASAWHPDGWPGAFSHGLPVGTDALNDILDCLGGRFCPRSEGFAGDDALNGSEADDALYGGSGNDYLKGAEVGATCWLVALGDDFLSGGGSGDNTFRFAAGDGTDRLSYWSWNEAKWERYLEFDTSVLPGRGDLVRKAVGTWMSDGNHLESMFPSISLIPGDRFPGWSESGPRRGLDHGGPVRRRHDLGLPGLA